MKYGKIYHPRASGVHGQKTTADWRKLVPESTPTGRMRQCEGCLLYKPLDSASNPRLMET